MLLFPGSFLLLFQSKDSPSRDVQKKKKKQEGEKKSVKEEDSDDGSDTGRPSPSRLKTAIKYRCKLTIIEPPHDKTNKMTVHPAKTQISLDMGPVWSESLLSEEIFGP